MQLFTILDIETIAQTESVIRAKLPPFDPGKVKLGVLKDPEKIRAKLAEAEAEHGNDEVANGALYPEHGETAIVGFLGSDYPEPLQYTHALSEADNLRETFAYMTHAFDGGRIITGWNIKGFDLPFLVKRAWLLGVRVPSRIFNPFKPRYPWSESLVDLMEIWSAGIYGDKYASLDGALRALGLPTKTGSGKDFGALWASDKAAALKYNADDLEREMQVAKRLLSH